MKRIVRTIATTFLLLSSPPVSAQTAAIVPPAMTQFVDLNGAPFAGGRVYFYIPTTTTPKATWQDPYQTTPNTNPVVLDAAGRGLIYGTGEYREVLQDSNGNTIWDQLTAGLTLPTGTGTGLPVYQNSPTLNTPTLFSPTMTGVPTAPTAAPSDNSTTVATTAYVTAAIATIVFPPGAVPSGAVLPFFLSSCPTGYVVADGTGSTVDMRGTVARDEDLGRGLDTSGTVLGGYEADMFQDHTMASPGGAFVTTPGGEVIGNSGAYGTVSFAFNSTGLPNTGNHGYETRAKSTVLLYCQKS